MAYIGTIYTSISHKAAKTIHQPVVWWITADCLLVKGIWSRIWRQTSTHGHLTSHSKSSQGYSQYQYLPELLVNVYNYCLMVKSVSCCCVCGSWLSSNSVTYCTNHPQLKRYTHVTCGVNHTRVGFLDTTCVYTHTVFTHERVFTHVHACMANVASYLSFSLSYNVIILVTLFFPYRALAAHQGVEDEIAEEVESTSLIL